MNSIEFKAKAKAALDEANALFASIAKPEDLTPELNAKIEAKNAEFDRMNLAAKMAEGIEQKGADYGRSQPAAAEAFAGWRRSTPAEGEVAYDSKSWRSLTVKTAFGEHELRYNVPIAVQGKDYASAHEAYLRNGIHRLGPNDIKALSIASDSAGGFLVPEDFQAVMLKKTATMAWMRKLARVITTGRDLVRLPRLNYGADDRYTSPVRLTWTGELPASSTAHLASDPTFGQITIPIHTAMASLPISKDLIEDAAFDIIGMAAGSMSEAFELGENDAFVNGNGIARPMGIVTNVGATNGITAIASGTDNSLSTSGDAHAGARLLKTYYAVPAQYRAANATWLMNSNTLRDIDLMVDANKRPLVRELTGASIADGEPSTIKSRRIVVDEFMPDVATGAYPIIFGDFKGYTIVDRVGFSIERLDQAYANLNMVALLARKRVGGDLTEGYRLRALKTSSS